MLTQNSKPDDSPSQPPPHSGETAENAQTYPAALRARAFLIGIPLLMFVSVLSVYADMSAQVIQFGVLQFSPPAVVALFALALLNVVWRQVRGQVLLRPGELLAVYAMLLVGVMVSTRGVIEKVIGSIAYLPYAVGNNAQFLPFLRHMPKWTVPYDPAFAVPPSPTITGFYEGTRGVVPWEDWLGPLCADFAAVIGVTLVFLGMATLLRRQWVDVEHLNFPLTSLPVAMMRNEADGRPLFSSPLLWGGIAIPTLVFGLNGLHANIPTLPQIAMSFDLAPMFQSPPWNGIGFCTAFLSLAVVGFAYFIPGDVLFSMWFFYIAINAQSVVAATVGYPGNVSGGWPSYEVAGAYFVIAAALYGQARPLLKAVWQTAFGKAGSVRLDDSAELMTYRRAFLCLAIGFAGVTVWLVAAGMSPLLAMFQMAVYLFVVALVMSRAVAQAGLLMTETSFLPQTVLGMFMPLHSLGPTNLTMLAVTNTFFAQDLRGELLAPFLDAQCTAGRIGSKPRTLLLPLVIGMAVALVTASVAFLHLHYAVGGNLLYGHPHDVANYEMSVLVGPLTGQRSSSSPGAFVVGALLAAVLTFLRARYAWFPLHPLGLALCASWSMKVFWFGFLVAWIIRTVIVRYGGINLYRKFSPLMLGLIIGEFSAAVFWASLHLAFQVTAPAFPWP